MTQDHAMTKTDFFKRHSGLPLKCIKCRGDVGLGNHRFDGDIAVLIVECTRCAAKMGIIYAIDYAVDIAADV